MTTPAKHAPRALKTRTTSPSADPALARIGGVDRERLAPGGLAARADRAGIHLAVQFVPRLA